ncbi:sulfurtransferase complex subunit TusB [Marinobacter salexigens]|uniref:sulfurtransferase complex subunit TusB n=1 Tax=Marinobacter salexigens TaxID=1925763 RepID=UPI000C29297F|nr:sulfurtransferase complex subunit TusB [Marinobacter salexigens]
MTHIHVLHILNKAPSHPRSVECLSALMPGDTLLLIENAVLAVASLNEYRAGIPVFALAPDVIARGLGECSENTTLVDFAAMVDLTAQAQQIISW